MKIRCLLTMSSTILIQTGTMQRTKSLINSKTLWAIDSIITLIKINIYGFYNDDGGVGTLVNRSLTISLCGIFLNQALNNGGVFSFYFSNNNGQASFYDILIIKSVIFQNKVQFQGGFVNIISTESEITSVNLFFMRDFVKFKAGFQGGVIYAENLNEIKLSFCNFSNNIAKENIVNNEIKSKGGVLYTINNQTSIEYPTGNGSINVSGSSFLENSGQIGGVFYIEGLPISSITNLNNNYFNNSAYFYGYNFATETDKLRFFSLDKDLSDLPIFQDNYAFGRISNLKSGVNYPTCLLQINGYDKFGSITYGTDENLLEKIQIQQLNIQSYSNTFNFTLNNGFICINGTFLREELPLDLSFEYKITTLFSEEFLIENQFLGWN